MSTEEWLLEAGPPWLALLHTHTRARANIATTHCACVVLARAQLFFCYAFVAFSRHKVHPLLFSYEPHFTSSLPTTSHLLLFHTQVVKYSITARLKVTRSNSDAAGSLDDD